MIDAIAAALLFFAGHVVRDGWPSFHEMTNGRLGTQAARISGAALCGVGALFIASPIIAFSVGMGILSGFYADMKHGEAAGVDTAKAVASAFLSGVTSVMPVAFMLALVTQDLRWLWLLDIGLLKPGIWWLAWALLRPIEDTWLQPTRIAAGVFGVAIAVALALGLGELP